MPANDVVRLVSLAPGHFHAALVQKEMLPEVDPHVHIYAPPGDDLAAHLERLARFNSRSDRPTAWTFDVHAGPDYLERFLAERSGNTVVISGRNKPKPELILAAVRNGYHVLADKPWVIDADDFGKVEETLREADRQRVVAWDVMTERHEATTLVQRELINEPTVFGTQIPGTAEHPGIVFESVHFLQKTVAGKPLCRPAWWFDLRVAGEALADVGTHLVDLSMWLTFPGQPIDYLRDVRLIDANRWPTPVSLLAFRGMTGQTEWPPELAKDVDSEGRLNYSGNGSVTFTLRDIVVRVTTRWEVRAATGGDTHLAIARGSRAAVAVRHEPEFGTEPQVFVTPVEPVSKAAILAAIAERCRALGPGYASTDLGDRIHVHVPTAVRTGHESHFAAVLREFVTYFKDPSLVPAWERPNLLTKYWVTTRAVEMGRPKRLRE
ncbi:MAG TPA: putative oxidoreductase C-terminal domain-containing protein [Gemmataceae bacterium]|nr:putative oxidoreductase C-terminal domain-containing protein [Gemmataceae bacterium]